MVKCWHDLSRDRVYNNQRLGHLNPALVPRVFFPRLLPAGFQYRFRYLAMSPLEKKP